MDQQLMRRQTGEVQAPGGPVATITQGFGEQSVALRGERAAEAVAAREQAMVQARFIVAIQRPRDVMDFRTRLLHECKRPGFAEVAMYKRPVGKEKQANGKWEEKFAEGPSIRMIETCLQLFRNVQTTTTTVYDDPSLRVVKVMVIDFENNISFEQEINVPKTVEKRGDRDGGPPKGREVLGKRTNSYGDDTYLVVATDDEVTIKQAAMVSKALRTCGQRLLPRDVIEEAISQIRATQAAEVKADPDAAKKKLVDAFAALSVNASDLSAYLGHSLDRVTPAELVKLREIHNAIKSGESSWEEFVEAANTIPNPELQKEVGERLKREAEEAKAKREAEQESKHQRSEAAAAPVEELPQSNDEPQTELGRFLAGDQSHPPAAKKRGF